MERVNAAWLAALTLAAGADLEARVRALFDGAARVVHLEIDERRAVIGLEVPREVRLEDLPPSIENAFEHAVGAIVAERDTARFDLLVAHPGEELRPPPRSERRGAKPRRAALVAPDPMRFPDGQALTGRTIAISPGHGWIYNDNLARFATQRGRIRWDNCGGCRGIIEDFETHEIVVDHLVALLEGAGARVILVRERAKTDATVIVDDGDAGYAEGAGMWTNATGGHGGDYRISTDASASVSWTLSAPSRGPDLVSLWFVAGADRAPGARLELITPSATRELLFDGATHGRRWTPIALIDVDRGAPITVRLSAPGMGRALVADAVRVGGGKHTSDHPWWEMGAQPYMAFVGAPSEVTRLGDVTTRPRYAEWQGADVYVSLHSNASGQPNSTAVGTSSYRYNCGSFPDHSNDPPAASCDDPTGSDRLQELVHRGLVDRLRADWDPNWRDRGTKVANFGELRELDGIPGVLIESAFHDNVVLPAGSTLRMTENQALHDPRVRRAMAYGIYEGISKYLAPMAGTVPKPPARLAARRVAPGAVELSFASAAGATRYRVYAARGGRSFDDGVVVAGSPTRIEGLPDAPCFFKVAALNAAGEGWTSPIVGAWPGASASPVLLIDGFEREDAWVEARDNRRDTIMQHGLALGVAFDGAEEAAVEPSGLGAYRAIVLALGRESTEHGVLTPALRSALEAFAAGGGAVFASGSELGWALGARGDAASQAFLSSVFGLAYAGDDAGETGVRAEAGGLFDGAGEIRLDDGTGGALEAKSSDSFTATDGVVVLRYANDAVAGVRRGANVAMGFALDSVVSDRAAILGRWAREVLGPTPAPDAGVDAGFAEDATPAEDASQVDTGTEDDAGFVDLGFADAVAADALLAPDGGVAAAEDARLTRQSVYPIRGGCGCGSAPGASTLWMAVPALLALGLRRAGASRRARQRA